MNIFEIFSGGKGKINEENMSSVLGFLLDPVASHGYGREALVTFLEPIEEDIKKLIKNNALIPLARGDDGIRVLLSQTKRIDIEFERAYVTEAPTATPAPTDLPRRTPEPVSPTPAGDESPAASESTTP